MSFLSRLFIWRWFRRLNKNSSTDFSGKSQAPMNNNFLITVATIIAIFSGVATFLADSTEFLNNMASNENEPAPIVLQTNITHKDKKLVIPKIQNEEKILLKMPSHNALVEKETSPQPPVILVSKAGEFDRYTLESSQQQDKNTFIRAKTNDSNLKKSKCRICI